MMGRINKPGNGSKTGSWPSGSHQLKDFYKETLQVHEESPWIIAQSGNVMDVSMHTLGEILKTVALADPSSEPPPVCEQFELLISARYELTRPLPIHIFRYEDGSVLINSMELNLYAEGHSEYEARKEFSEVLTILDRLIKEIPSDENC
jgi:hypothetical protein